MKVLVTGAAGFLGGHLVDLLVERGDAVRALVRPVEDARYLQTLSGVEIVQGDLTDAKSLKSAVQGVQRVYNVAAKTGPWGSEEEYHATNVQGVLDLIAASVDAGVERIVQTSSITVYGHHLHGVVSEEHPYHAENNPYSHSKITSEKLIFKLVKEQGAPVVVIRPGWIYGPRDPASFGRFVKLVESGKGFFLGPGTNIVPIVYVRDVAQGLIKAGDISDEAIGRVYNIVDDRRVTQMQYLNTIAEALHVPHVTRRIPFAAAYLAGSSAEFVWRALQRRTKAPPPIMTYGVTLLGGDQQFSIERARRELGYSPQFDVTRGVAEGVHWYLHQKP